MHHERHTTAGSQTWPEASGDELLPQLQSHLSTLVEEDELWGLFDQAKDAVRYGGDGKTEVVLEALTALREGLEDAAERAVNGTSPFRMQTILTLAGAAFDIACLEEGLRGLVEEGDPLEALVPA